MSAKEEIKKTVISEPIRIVLRLLAPIIGTLILAAIPQVRDRVWPATPKLLLMALTVVFLSASLVLFRLLLKSRRELKEAQVVYESELRESKTAYEKLQTKIQATPPPKRPKFGVMWDENLEPFCPVHTDIPLNNWLRVGHHTGYMCPGGGHMVTLRDDAGRLITPKEARAKLAGSIKGDI